MSSPTAIDVESRTVAKKWIQKAKIKKGAFTKKADAAGESVHEHAEKEKAASGKTGKQARLALTFEGMNKRKKLYDNPRSAR